MKDSARRLMNPRCNCSSRNLSFLFNLEWNSNQTSQGELYYQDRTNRKCTTYDTDNGINYLY